MRMIFRVAVTAAALRCTPLQMCALPPLPNGSELKLLEADDAGIGGRLWNAAALLCRWQLSIAEQIGGSRVLELGSGTGACGLFAAKLGAARVVLTDGGNEALMSLLAANAAANSDITETVEVAAFLWGDDTRADQLATDVELVIASDVTYDDALHDALCQSLRGLLLHGDASVRAILCEEHGPPRETEVEGRFFDEQLESFAASAADHGLAVEPFVLEDDGGERAISPRVWPIATFSEAECFLLEVRLTDVRDVIAEGLVLSE